ncbi:hypothetical protein [Parachitinimonas caeni]|uniref:Transmembrane protein n=1 Tax=Parachitinimonas caeni TaxID=3031301 RepID=A0ABT7DV32_9NEIS|nr:hypothetical protein [Parachitinimonas caeni]MDK2123931.1 hypothetical protein [Parachitinimonas caeni]
MLAKRLILILWPSFVAAGALNCLFFALFDPLELTVSGEPLFTSRLLAYSLGFFAFWMFTAASSMLTVFFQKEKSQVDGYCPVNMNKPGSNGGTDLAH